MNIKIVSDSTCDLSPALVEKHNVGIFPLTVVKDGQDYKDNVTITPDDIFAHVAAGGSLCSTSAGSLGDYMDFFAGYSKDYDAVIHVSLGSGFSSSYQNACLAAQEYDNVYVVDSQNLSTGHGLVVLKACALAADCNDPKALQQTLSDFAGKVEASFVLDQLQYMVKGGRCSAAAALGANLLNLKPCIEVKDGKMGVVKKYRGSYAKCLASYVKDRLDGRDDIDNSFLFITYTTVTEECLETVKQATETYGSFEEVEITNAGCTVSCHCGPSTLGILFVRK